MGLTPRKKQEPLPTLKAAIRLLTHIFSVAIDTPEFQRQIASPNVPKFSLALIVIAEEHASRELKVGASRILLPLLAHDSTFQLLAIDALSVLVPFYPTLFKALHGRLSALCLRQFNGAVGRPTDGPLAQTTSRLYSVLVLTGGKVGAAVLWRKSVDEILSIGWSSLHAVRTTFPRDGPIPLSQHIFKNCVLNTKFFSRRGTSPTLPAPQGRRDVVRPVESRSSPMRHSCALRPSNVYTHAFFFGLIQR